jgi:hypothetical protein
MQLLFYCGTAACRTGSDFRCLRIHRGGWRQTKKISSERGCSAAVPRSPIQMVATPRSVSSAVQPITRKVSHAVKPVKTDSPHSETEKPPAQVLVDGQQNMLCVACFQPTTVSSHPTTGRPRHNNQRTSPETLWESSATLACHSCQSKCERYEYVNSNLVLCMEDLQSRSVEQAVRHPCGPQHNPHPTATQYRATVRSPSSPNVEWASKISDTKRLG